MTTRAERELEIMRAGLDDLERAAAAKALRDAAAAAVGMHDPAAPDCAEWATWLRARADRIERGDA